VTPCIENEGMLRSVVLFSCRSQRKERVKKRGRMQTVSYFSIRILIRANGRQSVAVVSCGLLWRIHCGLQWPGLQLHAFPRTSATSLYCVPPPAAHWKPANRGQTQRSPTRPSFASL